MPLRATAVKCGRAYGCITHSLHGLQQLSRQLRLFIEFLRSNLVIIRMFGKVIESHGTTFPINVCVVNEGHSPDR